MKVIKSGEESGDKLNILVCGDSGMGKTCFGVSGNKDKTLILSADRGLKSVAKDIDTIVIDDFQTLVDAANNIWEDDSFKKYETIFIDGLGKIQSNCLSYITGENQSNLTERKQATQANWGALNTLMTKVLHHFKKMDKNLVVSCLVEYHTNEDTGETRITPKVKGSLRDELMAFFDVCIHLDTKEGKDGDNVYFGVTQRSRKYLGKDRIGLPKFIKNPTIDMLNQIQKEK